MSLARISSNGRRAGVAGLLAVALTFGLEPEAFGSPFWGGTVGARKLALEDPAKSVQSDPIRVRPVRRPDMGGGARVGLARSLAPLVGPLVVVDAIAPETLAQSLAGEGVTISNVTYAGTTQSSGTFSNGAEIIGFAEGIILSSGFATDVVGPNDADGKSRSLGTGSDPDLTALSGVNTNDKTVLEFDFVPQSSTLTFQYVFASEEYNEFVNSSFNDVFAFFANGGNCAVVPGTGDPVSINTVNGGNPFGSDATNPSFYRNNDPNDPGPPAIDTQADGLTVVLTCVTAVNANVSNHIKLAIADGSDSILDSWVFIKAGSFTSSDITLDPPTATNPIDTPHTVTAKVLEAALPVEGKLVTFTVLEGPHAGVTGTDTTDENGEATFTYTGTSVGTDKIQASFLDSLNRVQKSNIVEKIWEDPPQIFSINPSLGPTIGGTSVTLTGIKFKTGAVVQIGGFPCEITAFSTTEITCTTHFNVEGPADVVVVNLDGGTDTLEDGFTYFCLAVEPTAEVSGDSEICAGDTANLTVDLTGLPPWKLAWSDGFEETGIVVTPHVRTVSPTETTVYTVTVVADSVCAGPGEASGTVTVKVVVSAITAPIALCPGAVRTASVPDAGVGATYDWLITGGAIITGAGTNEISFEAGGLGTLHLEVTVTALGCVSVGTLDIAIEAPATATLSGADATICAGESTPLTVDLTGTAPWSIAFSDGFITTDVTTTPYVREVSPSANTVYTLVGVSDVKQCGGGVSGSASIEVLPVPSAAMTTPTLICHDTEISTASVPDAGPGATYLWEIENGTITGGQGTREITFSVGTASPVILTVTVTAQNGCSSTNTEEIPVAPSLSATVSGDDVTVCSGSGVTLYVTLTGTPPFVINWSDGLQQISNPSQLLRVVNPTETTTYSILSVTDASSCPGTTDGSVTITVPQPSAAITAASSVCAGSTGNVASMPDNGVDAIYEWVITNGTITSGNGTRTITFTAGSGPTLTIASAVTVPPGCKVTSGKQINVNGVPTTPIISAPASANPGQTGLVASVTNHAGATYDWSITNGTITGGDGTNSITFTAGVTGVLTLTVIETSAASCASAQATANVPVGGGCTGFEGDVAPRPNGNGSVTTSDWVQCGRFAAALDTAAPGCEFQKADVAPAGSKGNGSISTSDWVQCGRYAAALDPLVTPGGPTGPSAARPGPFLAREGVGKDRQGDRRLQLHAKANGWASVVLRGLGDESAVGFSIRFDPERYELESVTKGRDVPAEALLFVNDRQASDGLIGVQLALPMETTFTSDREEVVVVKLRARSRGVGPALLQFADEPVQREVVNEKALTLPAFYEVSGLTAAD